MDMYASKEDYANALRAYQAAVEATKSAERETAGKKLELLLDVVVRLCLWSEYYVRNMLSQIYFFSDLEKE